MLATQSGSDSEESGGSSSVAIFSSAGPTPTTERIRATFSTAPSTVMRLRGGAARCPDFVGPTTDERQVLGPSRWLERVDNPREAIDPLLRHRNCRRQAEGHAVEHHRHLPAEAPHRTQGASRCLEVIVRDDFNDIDAIEMHEMLAASGARQPKPTWSRVVNCRNLRSRLRRSRSRHRTRWHHIRSRRTNYRTRAAEIACARRFDRFRAERTHRRPLLTLSPRGPRWRTTRRGDVGANGTGR